jgi:AmiR/NasT family two-component response regulator
VIEQAKGVLAERERIGVDAAFARLRNHARDHNRRLSEVARELIAGQLDAAVVAKTASGASSFER